MSKPKWLKEAEKKKTKRKPKTCGECKHLGTPIKKVKHNKKPDVHYECAIHPGCYNTEHAIRCGDWEPDT